MSKAPIALDPDRPPNPAPDKARRDDSPRPLVAALRRLLEAAGPPALPFLRDWPRDSTPRSFAARSLPVVSALDGLERFAAPDTRALVQAVAARAGDLDWRQTYRSADFGERFLQNYGFSEWAGKRGAFESDAIACGVLLLGPDIEYPAHSHEAEDSISPWRATLGGVPPSPTGGCARRGHGSIIPPGRPTLCARTPSPCSRPMSGARATSRRNRASTAERLDSPGNAIGRLTNRRPMRRKGEAQQAGIVRDSQA